MKNIKIKKASLLFFLFLFTIPVSGQLAPKNPQKDYYKTLIKNFKSPQADYSTAPFWVWNEVITQKGIDEQLKDYKSRGILQVIIHPRPGLVTSYLTDEWFGLVKYSVQKAKALGMKIWLYDENSYPSGFAGGEVPAQLPDTRGKMLQLVKTSDISKVTQETAFILKKEGDRYSEINKADIKPGEEYYVFVYQYAGKSSWYGGYYYVDIMQRKTTDKFLEVTHDKYKKTIGNEFGKTVLGIFTDEPNIRVTGGENVICYTPELFERFKKRWGYDLKINMPLLFDEVGDWKKVRHNYYSILHDLFVDNWARPVSEYCEKNNLPLTGHYWEHDWPIPRNASDNMALAAYSQVPGIDLLMNQWSDKPYAQFGNNRFVKEIGSVANQLGRKRTISETYGASGWDLTFNDMKRIGDWEYALGVNIMNQHLSYYSLTGPRKRDHPLSFSYHSPYWDDYKLLADYYSRLSMILSQGKQRNNVLVLEPTTTGWIYFNLYSSYENQDPNRGKDRYFNKLANSFGEFINALENWQIEYDLGCEDIMKNHGSVDFNILKIGEASYNLVVIPPLTDNLDSKTILLLEKYLDKGGKILSTLVLPKYIDGTESNKIKLLAEKYESQWKQVPVITKPDINSMIEPGILFAFGTENNLLFHHRRSIEDAEIIFLTNIKEGASVVGSLQVKGGDVEALDCFTGKTSPYSFWEDGENVIAQFNIPPSGSLILAVKREKGKGIYEIEKSESIVEFASPLKVDRITSNVLTIDFCDLKIGEKTWKDLYFYQAQTETFKAVGMSRSPWDNSVQYKNEIVANNSFPKESGFTADYFFNVDNGVDTKGMQLAAERPERFTVLINDKPVIAVKGKWWLDKDFGVYNIEAFVKPGSNKVTITAMPMNVFAELESIYILGNFSLAPAEKGFKIIPSAKLTLGPWNKQGMMLYGNKVAYSHSVNIMDLKREYFVKLNKWEGSCAEVFVNGKKAGIIGFAPFELEISKFLKKGDNDIKVQVVGTLRNTLGPHHAVSKGSCWPSMFQSVQKDFTLAGGSYATNPYGLMEDFKVIIKTNLDKTLQE